MTRARDQILSAVRGALKQQSHDAAAVESRLADHPRGPLPARAQIPHGEQLELFVKMAREVAASVAQVPDLADVPKAVSDYLKAENLPAALRMAPDAELEVLPWDDQPLLTITKGPSDGSDLVSLTGAFAGVAETGTLALLSGPGGPTTLNFLPDHHLVVLKARDIVGLYEEVWDQLRDRFGPGKLPRTVNFVTGPSRTADIEQTIQLGAHGPRRLHILLVGDGTGDG